jgi:co-chaperonin GroES (HSP10)
MLNGNVLVDKYFDDDFEDVNVGDNTLRAKVKQGLIVDLNEKPKHLTGTLRHIGLQIGDDTRETIAPGELVMFRPSSEFENLIEGHEYYVMKQWDIMAKVIRPDKELDELLADHPQIEVNNLLPVGDYVLLQPEDLDFKPEILKHVYDPNAKDQDFQPGEIFVLGVSLRNAKKEFKFGVGLVLGAGENVRPSLHGKRVAHGKGAFYLVLKEYNKVLIRAGDVYGEFTDEPEKHISEVEE